MDNISKATMATNPSNPLFEASRRAQMQPQSLRAVRSWLVEQLATHEFAKLGQGGHTQNQVPLRRVFVDLPVTDSVGEDASNSGSRTLFLSNLLASKKVRFKDAQERDVHQLKAESVEESDLGVGSMLKGRRSQAYSVSLLIGGPGQGKSTLGQLACQLHRAALLLPFLDDLTSSERELVRSFQQTEGGRSPIRLPASPYLPLQVALPDFAGWLGRDKGSGSGSAPALLRFLADLPSARKCGLSSDDLFLLSCHLPILLVLDGFDEVGAALDRERIVVEARILLSQLARVGSGGQIIATTRPQGYAGELEKIGVSLRPRYLSPLRRDEALAYAKKLVEAKIQGADLQTKALQRLQEAAMEEATQRLLTTPLQVTILTALVQQLGRAPRERWNLFSRYFAYTYDREVERETYASRLLAEHRGHIEQIHARVALILQVEAERDGGAAARMPKAQLEQVIADVLSEDEVSDTEKDELIQAIAKAAEQRLVFLVEPEPRSFGFEIRSLQEFMAAWALTSGREDDVLARIQQVARAPMFRNVVLFAASRLYSEASALRDAIAERVCVEMESDPSDAYSRSVRAGAQLALDTLEEGAVLTQPKRARALMEQAVRLLALPADAEHVRLARASNADTVTVLRTAVEQCFIAARDLQKVSPHAATVVLIEAGNKGELWAMEVVDQYWKSLIEHQDWIRACARLSIPLMPWLARKIEGSAERFFPESFTNLRISPQSGGANNWVQWLCLVFGREDRWKRRRGNVPINYIAPFEAAVNLKAPDAPYPPSWSAWIAAAQFEVQPSAKALAHALREVALFPREIASRYLRWESAWPLSACLEFADGEADLRRLSDAAEQGQLGDAEQWLTAQAKWSERFDVQSALQTAGEHLPWSVETIQVGPPLLSMPSWILAEWNGRFLRGTPFATYKVARARFLSTKVTGIRVRAAEICLFACRAMASRKSMPSEADIRSYIAVAPEAGIALGSRPPNLAPDAWLRLLDYMSVPATLWVYEGFPKAVAAVRDSKGHPVALRMAVLHADLHARHEGAFRQDLQDHWRTELGQLLLGIVPRGHQAAADLITLQAAMGLLEGVDVDQVLDTLTRAGAEDPEVFSRFVNLVGTVKGAESRPGDFLSRALEIDPLHESIALQIIQRLRQILQFRKSDLHIQSTWRRLALPRPYPGAAALLSPNGIPLAPIVLERINVRDVGRIHSLELNFSPPVAEQGQWIVLIGPNGSGKTTLLRSIALALRNARDPAIWPRGSFSVSWIRIADSNATVTDAITEAEITIAVAGNQSYNTVVNTQSSISILQVPEFQMPRAFPVFAYGCRRGSALGGASRQVDLSDDDGPEVATLFDEGAALVHAETWLMQLEGDAQKNANSLALYEAVVGALCRLLDVSKLYVSDRRVWVIEHGRSPIPFASMSDGYLTSAGWFLDFVARWLALAEKNGRFPSGGFLEGMTGLVLIDEIDLHLHPRWQLEIISRTRKILPRVSFVVTTHNPLTLVGAKADEVWMLSQQDGKVVASRGHDLPMLLTGGQIYRRYFGIEDIYPESIGRSLQRYSFLSGYSGRTEAEEAELQMLADELLRFGVNTGWETSVQEGVSPNDRDAPNS